MQKILENFSNNNGEMVGSIFGYITDDLEIINNFLESNDYFSDEDNLNLSKYKGNRIGVIKNLYVDKEFRNDGRGNDLMNSILHDFDLYDVTHILLVCDNIESNDFNLQSWYESFGFKIIKDKFNCPLMEKKI